MYRLARVVGALTALTLATSGLLATPAEATTITAKRLLAKLAVRAETGSATVAIRAAR